MELGSSICLTLSSIRKALKAIDEVWHSIMLTSSLACELQAPARTYGSRSVASSGK